MGFAGGILVCHIVDQTVGQSDDGHLYVGDPSEGSYYAKHLGDWHETSEKDDSSNNGLQKTIHHKTDTSLAHESNILTIFATLWRGRTIFHALPHYDARTHTRAAKAVRKAPQRAN